jgi:hypothetical protein
LLRLGRSFSVMAEARQLVTAGVYRHVRHPLYLAEEIAAVGCAMQFFSLWAVLLLAAQIAFQLRRMANEERVLTQSFPEYARYRQNTARLIPGLDQGTIRLNRNVTPAQAGVQGGVSPVPLDSRFRGNDDSICEIPL